MKKKEIRKALHKVEMMSYDLIKDNRMLLEEFGIEPNKFDKYSLDKVLDNYDNLDDNEVLVYLIGIRDGLKLALDELEAVKPI